MNVTLYILSNLKSSCTYKQGSLTCALFDFRYPLSIVVAVRHFILGSACKNHSTSTAVVQIYAVVMRRCVRDLVTPNVC